MNEKIIQTKRGVYGVVNVTLPLSFKTTMISFQKKSGMKKAEFFRMALTTGFLELSRGIGASDADHSGNTAQECPSASFSEDGRPAPLPVAGLS